MIIDNEKWQSVVGFEGLYEVSNQGRVKSLPRQLRRFNRAILSKERILKPYIVKGYEAVSLHGVEGNPKHFYIHRLVALAFIANPLNLPQINHKDENKLNNCVENLEWCDALYNLNYGSVRFKISESHRKLHKGIAILQINPKSDEVINVFASICEASKLTGISRTTIGRVCKNEGYYHTAGGYKWSYKYDRRGINRETTLAT